MVDISVGDYTHILHPLLRGCLSWMQLYCVKWQRHNELSSCFRSVPIPYGVSEMNLYRAGRLMLSLTPLEGSGTRTCLYRAFPESSPRWRQSMLKCSWASLDILWASLQLWVTSHSSEYGTIMTRKHHKSICTSLNMDDVLHFKKSTLLALCLYFLSPDQKKK